MKSRISLLVLALLLSVTAGRALPQQTPVQARVGACDALSSCNSAGGGGGGGVSSVGLSFSPSSIGTVTNSPITGSGVIGLTLNNQNPFTLLAGPSTTGPAAQPTFRLAVPEDIPGVTRSIANAASTGTTQYKTVVYTGAPSAVVITPNTNTNGVVGICVLGCGTTGNAYIQESGIASCVFDGATTAGDYVQISSGTNGDCTDAGSTLPTSGQILGIVLTTNGGTGTYQMDLFPPTVLGAAPATCPTGQINIGGSCHVFSVGLGLPGIFSVTVSPIATNGTISGSLTATLANENANTVFAGPSSGSATTPTFRALTPQDVPGNTITVVNDGSTGTATNNLTVFTTANPSAAKIAPAGSSTGVKGPCILGCGTSGTAYIQQSGTAYCVFDGATTAGDYVQMSAGTAGACTDGGAAYPSSGGQVLGVVRSTNASSGTYLVDFFSPDVQLGSGGGGNALAAWLTPHRVTTSGATLSVDLSTSGNQFITLHDTITLSFTHHPPDGWIPRFKLTQSNSGSHTVTWPASVQWPSATAPTLTTTNGQSDFIQCLYDGTTTNYTCSYVLNFVP